MSVLIKKGHVLDPSTGVDGIRDLYVKNGLVAAVGKNLEITADVVIDAEGLYVMPGFIDLHVHLREPGFEYKETIMTGSRAAARGGFTTICPMPNTRPAIDSKEMIEWLKEKEKKEARVHILPIGAVTYGQAGEELADIAGMAASGAAAISEDGKSVMSTSLYREGMLKAKEAGIPVFAHCEDKDLAGDGVINEGNVAKELHLPGISNAVEDIIAIRDILLAKETGVRLHLCHCSTKDSVAFLEWAKKEGLPVTGEVCPHHFTLTDDDIPCDDSNYKMNPPLRSKEDVQALKEGLKNGVLDAIATDHAPHSKEEKEKSFLHSPFGIVGLETAFALSYTELVEPGILTFMELVKKLSYNPADILGIERGSLREGKAADIVIVDTGEWYKIDKETFASMGRNTPFHGRRVKGKIKYTLVDGQVVYKD
ncbi:dihydroorotase [Anaerocolumna xylanovorans]|uniref:Dihydroorotase n=1 Tax=Anaerocolumna xylanovorans DSM 12503 TaxID=1121345 RepID=A0A1M7YFW3_9FIRM|nr:dihydroorotase [Anaerocolumna xylanovorans]SHO51510.1 dihydroorotase [Anaerocolumna xylanovorans DSM 12503]